MTNTLCSPADLVEFGSFSDMMVDIAVADLRRKAGWHIAPTVTETIQMMSRQHPSWHYADIGNGSLGGGQEIVLPTRSFPDAPVTVISIDFRGTALDGWELQSGEVLFRWWRWPWGPLSVTLTHGFATCPVDLLPLLAERANTSSNPRDSRVTSFTNGGVQMAFGDAYQLDPVISAYSTLAGVA